MRPGGFGLPSLIDVTEKTIRKKAENVNSYWEVLQYKVDKETADAIELFIQTNGINCITLNQGSKRVYPFDDLAASVLGFVNAYDNRGAYDSDPATEQDTDRKRGQNCFC